jgi:hypothetical protein
MCSIVSLSLHSTFCTFFALLHPIPVVSLLFPTFDSRHHFSLSCIISPQVLRNLLSYTIIDSLILSLLSCLSVSLSFSLSSTFLHLPFALNLSASSLAYPFLSLLLLRVFFFFSLQHSVSILHSSLQTLPLSYRFHSQPIPFTLFLHYVIWRFSVLS